MPVQQVRAHAEVMGSFPPPTEHSEQLAADNLGLAMKEASLLAARTCQPYEDLYPVALYGLLKGCRKYDPFRINPSTNRPYRLSSLVVPFIRGALWQYLRTHGHRSGVRFPDAWRDRAPMVRRMIGDGCDLAAVSEATGLSQAQISEILQAQSPVDEFDAANIKHVGRHVAGEELEICHELQAALEDADLAFCALEWADRQALVMAWESRRRQLCRLPHGQFLTNVRKLSKGQRLPEPWLREMPVTTEQAQQVIATVQLDMFSDSGKPETAEQSVSSAPGHQSSN